MSTKIMSTKQERLENANELIRIIGSHGRRFFYSKERDTFARLELRNGRVWWVDDYRGGEVYTHRTGLHNSWRGFSHGGTLRSLVEDMRDYITSGRKIERWKIVIRQLNSKGLENNIWGYSEEDATTVRERAYTLPIIEPGTPPNAELTWRGD
jgi:hypothetical protein